MAKLDPIVSEFDTDEDAEAYDKWFREQVVAALASKKPRLSNDDVFSRTRAILNRRDIAASHLGA